MDRGTLLLAATWVFYEMKKGFYNLDITVVKENPAFWEISSATITNPFILVEVLSESTAAYDLQHKLPKYQTIESLQEVVFVDHFDLPVSVFRRTDTANSWTQTIYEKPDERVRIALEHEVPVRSFFADLPAEALGDSMTQ